MHGISEVNSAILRELQDTSWNTAVSENSPLKRDVTSHDVTSHDVTSHDVTSHDVTSHDASSSTTSRDVIPSSRFITPISSNPNLVLRKNPKNSLSDLLSRKPGLPSHSSTPSIPEPSKRKLCNTRKSSRKSCRKHASRLFFVSSSDSDNKSVSGTENKIICRRDITFSSFDLSKSNNSIKPENQSCTTAKVEKRIKLVNINNSRLGKSSCSREKSARERLRNRRSESIGKTRSIGKLFFYKDEELNDEDLWDPTPNLSSLSQLVKSDNSKTPAQLAKSPALLAKSPAQLAKSPAQLAKSPAQLAKSPAQLEKSPAPLAKSPAQLAKSPVPLAKSPVSGESCFKNYNHLETSLWNKHAVRPTKLFFCDPSYISSVSTEEKAWSKCRHSALSSDNKDVKSEMKLEECVEPSLKIEKVEKIEHLPGWQHFIFFSPHFLPLP